jgi:hypothetical protein
MRPENLKMRPWESIHPVSMPLCLNSRIRSNSLYHQKRSIKTNEGEGEPMVFLTLRLA